MIVSIEISLKISVISFVCAVLVVFVHMPMISGTCITSRIEQFFGGNISQIAVPWFFIVSGYFLGHHIYEKEWYKRVLRKRLSTLLVPYLFWCVVLSAVSNLWPLVANVMHNQPLTRNLTYLNPMRVLGIDIRYTPPLPLWYMRELMLLVVISPLLANIVKFKKYSVGILVILFVLAGLQLSFVPYEEREIYVYTLSLANVFWFSVGMFLSQNLVRVPVGVGRFLLIVGMMMFVFHVFSPMLFDGMHVLEYFFQYLAIAFTLIGIWSVCPVVTLPSWLRNQSFPIYLLHSIFISGICLLNGYYSSYVTSLYGYVCFLLIAVFGSVASSIILKRKMPTFESLVFWGR